MANSWLRNRLFVLTVLLVLGTVILWQDSSLAIGSYLASTFDSHNARSAIPSIVHFVQLRKDEASELHFPFEAFLALYAAYRSIAPTTIYIHTDFSREDISSAIEHGSSWTRKVLTSFPNTVHLNHVSAPTEANGLKIQRVEHRSDFVRLEQLAKYGGIYLDWDVVTLRPLTPLLNSGFRTVVGRQFDNFINNGIILASKDSALVEVMRQETPQVFDGGWITHSVSLLTKVADRLAGIPGEVLIMDFKAFAPFEWSQASVNKELERHVGDAVVEDPAESLDTADAKQPWKASRMRKDWEYDFRDTYFLHKFYNDVDSPKGFEGVTVPYILAHDSNYALATWPIVMQGIQEGFIDPKDGSL